MIARYTYWPGSMSIPLSIRTPVCRGQLASCYSVSLAHMLQSSQGFRPYTCWFRMGVSNIQNKKVLYPIQVKTWYFHPRVNSMMAIPVRELMIRALGLVWIPQRYRQYWMSRHWRTATGLKTWYFHGSVTIASVTISAVSENRKIWVVAESCLQLGI